MATSTQLEDGTGIEEGEHLLVTCENSDADQFEGETPMQAQRIEDKELTARIYFHDQNGEEALYVVVVRGEPTKLKLTGTDLPVADVVGLEVRDDD